MAPLQKHLGGKMQENKPASFIAVMIEHMGTAPERNGPETRYRLQDHISMAHPDIPKSPFLILSQSS